jgi:pimeloyl-ACP methyl ester carboxylesterase
MSDIARREDSVDRVTPVQTSSSSKAEQFEEIYRKVPPAQVDRLKQFRLSHPYKQLSFRDANWEYISCGQSDETILVLPGALSTGESAFPLITALEADNHIIAPSYPLSLTMEGLCDGIAHILAAENVDSAHVFGGSYGGLVAQYFVRQYPGKSRSLILSHTFVFNPKYTSAFWIAGKVFPSLPQSLTIRLLNLRLDKLLLSRLRAANHPEAEFWRAYLDEAMASGKLKDVFIHQNKCLLDLADRPPFTENDLNEWPGPILIIESEDDPAIGANERAKLRNMYPRAQMKSFLDAGHASSILKRDEVVSSIKGFLDSIGRKE